jgi:hypothetical protein
MKTKQVLLILLFAISAISIGGCEFFEKIFGGKERQSFSGKVVDSGNNAIIGALVEIGEVSTTTRDSGKFDLAVDSIDRYVLNVTQLGFGFVSKIYNTSTSNIVITMTAATVVTELDPAVEIVIEDTTPAPSIPVSPDIAHISSPLDTLPFIYDPNGRLIGFGAPQKVIDTYEAIDNFAPPVVGATIVVEPDALEDPDGDKAEGSLYQKVKGKGNVTGSLSTVDIYSPDGMPGDNTTRMGDGSSGFMVTYGAADVNFYRNGKPLQLKSGKFATLTIPVDTLALIYGQKLPETIPLLVYDKKSGLWARDGANVGQLNKTRTAYVAKISHFSVFNMDEEFDAGEATCYKMCISGTPPAVPGVPMIQITGDIPGHVKTLTLGTSICSPTTGGCVAGDAFAINNMKPNTPIGVRLLKGTTIISSYVFVTGNSGVNAVNCTTPNPNYGGCGGPVQMDWGSSPCYMGTGGIMSSPILAINRTGTNVEFSILHIQNILADGSVSNVPTFYQIQFKVQTAGDDIYNNVLGWSNLVDWDPTPVSNTQTLPVSTHWIVKANATFDASVTGANQTMPTSAVFFRVLYSPNSGGPFTTGAAISAINLPSGDLRDSFEGVPGLCRIN